MKKIAILFTISFFVVPFSFADSEENSTLNTNNNELNQLEKSIEDNSNESDDSSVINVNEEETSSVSEEEISE
jgi:hypothetical protein